MAAAPARRVLLMALASRALVLGAMALSAWAFADLDSSARLGAALACASADAATDADASNRHSAAAPAASTRLPLPVWDAVYFSRVAKCGYETDKINAFFPLLPAAMHAAARAAGARPAARCCCCERACWGKKAARLCQRLGRTGG